MGKLNQRIRKPIYLLIFLALIVINHYLSRFGIYGSNGYLSFLIENGPFISLGFAFIGVVWNDMDSNTDLISSNPCDYVKGYWIIFTALLISSTSISLAASLEGLQVEKEKKAPRMETAFAILISIFFAVALLIWSLVIGPPMYFANLIVGAPARLSIRALSYDQTLRVGVVNSETNEEDKRFRNFFEQRPVTATAVTLSLLLWMLREIVF